MVKTRGGLSASPSSPTPRPQRAAMGAAPSPPVQAPAIPPSEGEVPSQRRYPTRRPPTKPVPPAEQAASSFSRPPAKRTRFSGPGEPSHAPQPEPATEEPRIPVDMPPEAIIRRPMIAGPPIEGNLDCRDRSFHSETYFDIEGAPAVPAPPELPRDEQLPQAQQDEILTDTTPHDPAAPTSVHMPEGIHPSSPITADAPPVMPTTPAPPSSSEPTVTVSLAEFRSLLIHVQLVFFD
ncbi:extensin-like [Vitis vinifera]|uniref:extensin-like n=1 Tax=Vitis vinifera TaxID=29760 RepID=UPI00053FB56F|nr:extensin-like [Vitis vinifera]